MSTNNIPQPTRKLVTSQATAPGLPSVSTATGNRTSGPITTSSTAIKADSAPSSKPAGWTVFVVILSLGLVGAGGFGYMEWENGNKLTAEVDGLNEKVSGLQADLAALKVENAKNIANYEDTKSKLELAENHGRELQTQLDEKQKTLTDTIADRDQMKATVASKDQELASKDSAATQLKDELEQLNKKANGLVLSGLGQDRELTNLREENEKLKKMTANSATKAGGTLDQADDKVVNTTQAAVKKPRPRGLAWVRLGEYKSGENKGKFYYVSRDGYTSELYSTRKEATEAAENRTGYTQPKLRNVTAENAP
jgi:hypothetical protein